MQVTMPSRVPLRRWWGQRCTDSALISSWSAALTLAIYTHHMRRHMTCAFSHASCLTFLLDIMLSSRASTYIHSCQAEKPMADLPFVPFGCFITAFDRRPFGPSQDARRICRTCCNSTVMLCCQSCRQCICQLHYAAGHSGTVPAVSNAVVTQVSAGFDAHWRDPLAGLQFRTSTFHHLAAQVKQLANAVAGECLNC